MSIITEVKAPNEVKEYTINWGDLHLGVDTISTSVWEPSVPSGLTEDSETQDTNVATVWLSGGTAGTLYAKTNRIVTAAGRTLEQTLIIPVFKR
jgi:hypothetical protein